MTNLEIMEKAVDYTTDIFEEVNYTTRVQSGRYTSKGLKNYADRYTAECLIRTILSEDGVCTDYPVGNIRDNMASIGKNGIINELLKNIVSVATYHRMKENPAGKTSGSLLKQNMSDDEKTVIIFNNLDYFGPEKAYSLLEDSDALYSACLAFAKYRRKETKYTMDYVSSVDPVAKYLNEKLQQYYEALEAEKVKSLK